GMSGSGRRGASDAVHAELRRQFLPLLQLIRHGVAVLVGGGDGGRRLAPFTSILGMWERWVEGRTKRSPLPRTHGYVRPGLYFSRPKRAPRQSCHRGMEPGG